MNKYFKYGLSSVVTVLLLGIAIEVLANGQYTTPSASIEEPYFNGPYIGIGAGIVGSRADVESFASDYTTNITITPVLRETYVHISGEEYHNFDMGKYGFDGNIFVGYGRTLNTSYYLGGELFGHYFSPTLKKLSHSMKVSDVFPDVYPEVPVLVVINSDMSTKVKNSYSFGGDIRAGYLVFPRTMVYVLFGLDYAQFNVKSEFAYNTIWATFPPIESFSGDIDNDFNKWKLGYMPGIGIETGLTDHISLRAQYEYTFYSSFSNSVEHKHYPLEPGDYYHEENLTTKIKPSRGLFTVKLSYLFN
jgi:opacity protein-like surface antigen